jgi:hypothetical protein
LSTYNKTVFTKAGVATDNPPLKTYAEFQQTAKTLVDKGGVQAAIWPSTTSGFYQPCFDYYQLLIAQTGGKGLIDNNEPHFNTPRTAWEWPLSGKAYTTRTWHPRSRTRATRSATRRPRWRFEDKVSRRHWDAQPAMGRSRSAARRTRICSRQIRIYRIARVGSDKGSNKGYPEICGTTERQRRAPHLV